MIVYAKISGDTVVLAPDTTVQGSIGANVIDLLAPFPKTAAVSVAVTLPTGQSTTPTFAGAKDATLITGNVSGIEEDGKELNIWRYTFQKPLTQFAGSLTVQFYVTTSDATTALTPLIVPIVKGVPFIMPKPDEASWNAVQQLYNRLLDAEQNATDAATAAANSAAAAAKSAEDAVTNAQKVIDDGIVKVNAEIDKGIAEVDAEVVKAEEYANISKTYSDNAAKSVEDAEQYAQYASQSAADAEAVVRNITEIIPADASAENKLTTESFVNSSIATNTATFRGTYDLTAEQLNALPWQNTNPTGNYYCDNNDYVFLTTKKDGQVIAYSRYKCVIAASTITWGYEYTLNNSSFTDEQWAAINSGITAEIVNSIPKIHNLSDGTVTGALNQLFDGGNTLDFTGKNPNAVAAGLLAKLGESDITKLTRGATGQYASSFGGKSIAKGKRGHAEGTSTIAAGNYSHAEGDNSVSLGNDSHAEGYQTTAQGNMSHSEGAGTVSEGTYSHAEGLNTKAGGSAAHSEGTGTSAPGAYAHAEGQATTASGTAAHASGTNTKASGNNSTATGLNTEASGDNATSEGNTTKASGNESHAEGNQNEARGAHSHVEGEKNIIYTDIAVSSGGGSGGGGTGGGDTPGGDTPGGDNPNYLDEHKGDNAHSEGWNNQTLGYGSHAEGGANKSWGHFSHVEGTQNTTGALVADGANYKISGGEYAHAEGAGNTAIGMCAHAEGNGTKASGANAHSEGYQSNAEGENSHAGGNNATARGRNSMAHGSYCVARKANQHIFGQSLDSINLEEGGAAVGILNESQANDLFEVGNGTSATTRSNAFRVLKDGRAKVQTAPTEDDDVVIKGSLKPGDGIVIEANPSGGVEVKVDPAKKYLSIDDISAGIAYKKTDTNEWYAISYTPEATPNRLVERDSYGDFKARRITVGSPANLEQCPRVLEVGANITINAPANTTEGTLTLTQLARLKETVGYYGKYSNHYLLLNKERYYPMSYEHQAGYRTYANVECEEGNVTVKAITVNLKTGAWVLNTKIVGDASPTYKHCMTFKLLDGGGTLINKLQFTVVAYSKLSAFPTTAQELKESHLLGNYNAVTDVIYKNASGTVSSRAVITALQADGDPLSAVDEVHVTLAGFAYMGDNNALELFEDNGALVLSSITDTITEV